MKKFILVIFLIMTVSGWRGLDTLEAAYVKIEKISEWGTPQYTYIKVHGKYAYCASERAGMDIFDIRNPSAVKRVAAYHPPTIIKGIATEGNYLYMASFSGLQIIDISNPVSPVLAGYYPGAYFGITKNGNYLYLLVENENIQVLDISNPFAPTAVGQLVGYRFTGEMIVKGNYLYNISFYGSLLVADVSNPANPRVIGKLENKSYHQVCISGHYAYASKNHGMAVIDISDPSAPQEKALYKPGDKYIYGQSIVTKDSFVYMGVRFNLSVGKNVGLEIIDISDPLSPQPAGRINAVTYPDWEWDFYLDINGNYLYAAEKGLRVYDLSNPAAPTEIFYQDSTHNSVRDLTVSGNYAYLSKDYDGIYILDISNPSRPEAIGSYDLTYAQDLFLSGKYLYTAGYHDGLIILDVSDPSSPRKVNEMKRDGAVLQLYIKDQYLYLLVNDYGVEIYDVTTPASPVKVGTLPLSEEADWWEGIIVNGNYAYCAYYNDYLNKFLVIDVSDPTTPVKVEEGLGSGLNINGNYLYAPEGINQRKIHIYDISDPTSLVEVATYDMFHGGSMAFNGDYAYIIDLWRGFHVLDVSTPSSFSLVGSYAGPFLRGLKSQGDYIYAIGETKFLIFKASLTNRAPKLVLDKTELFFGVDASGVVSPPQKVAVTNGGGGNLNWELSTSDDFIKARPYTSSTVNEIYVGIEPSALSAGINTHKGTVTVTDDVASNSPLTITVTVTTYGKGKTKSPFGKFATPFSNTTVQGSIPVTGWALDDIGIRSLKIYREAGVHLALVGEAGFVEGARPDVETKFTHYPMNYSAGWGYMLLTNFLPEGDGRYTLHAIATDMEGNQTTLGTKTIVVSNGNAVKPFGTIDTPIQNGVASGSAYTNFGWALTPQPKTIPVDGSTIKVYIDGQFQGNPVYNISRSDIQTLFPGYNNTNGALGYFQLDTTKFKNGIHTIQWVVSDDERETDGIGSRYFKIMNTDDTYTVPQQQGNSSPSHDLNGIPLDETGKLLIKIGLERNNRVNEVFSDEKGFYRIVIQELGNLEIGFAKDACVDGYMAAGNRLAPLPVGSSFNRDKNVFYWHASLGFFGEYRLIFVEKDGAGNIRKKNVLITILPK